jgi:probable F420-dependent oxidoreductase
MKPQLSIQIPNFAEQTDGWEHTLAIARLADRIGVDRVVVSEHTLYGERLDEYARPEVGGMPGGKQPTGPDGHWLDPLTVLSFVAAQTSRVRVGTAVLLAALRSPSVLAKQLATLDVLSGGRLDLGVGVGWQREEYEAAGLSFEQRGTLLDRCLELCQRLWTEQVVDHDDGQYRFERIHAMPKPLQPGGVPIWVSGRATPRTAARVARFGAGWIPWGDAMGDPSASMAVVREAWSAAAHDPATLQVQGGLPAVREDGQLQVAATMERTATLAAAGVTDFRFHGRWGVDLAAEEDLLTSVVDGFRATFGE